MANVARLTMEVNDADVIRAATSLDRMTASGRQAQGASQQMTAAKRTEAIAHDQVAAAVDRSSARMSAATSRQRNFGIAVQQAGYQVGDFFTQIASGTFWMVSLSQQLPQLLGMFGALGSVAGAAVAMLGAYALYQRNAKRDAESFEDSLEGLNKTLAAHRDFADNAATSQADLAEKFGASTERARELLGLMETMAKVDLESFGKDALSTLVGPGTFGTSRERTSSLNEIQDMFSLRRSRGLRSGADVPALEYMQAEQNAAGANGLDARIQATETLLSLTQQMADASGDVNEAERVRISYLAELLSKMYEAKALRDEEGDTFMDPDRVRNRQMQAYGEYGNSRMDGLALDDEAAQERRVNAEKLYQELRAEGAALAAEIEQRTSDRQAAAWELLQEKRVAGAEFVAEMEDAQQERRMRAYKLLQEKRAEGAEFDSEQEEKTLERQINAYKLLQDKMTEGAAFQEEQDQKRIDAMIAAYEYLAETRAVSDEALSVYEAELEALQDQADMQDLIRKYGEDSLEVRTAQVQAARNVYVEEVASADMADELKQQLIAAWDAANGVALVDMAGNIGLAADEAARLVANLNAFAMMNPITADMRDEDLAMSQELVGAGVRNDNAKALTNYNRLVDRQNKAAARAAKKGGAKKKKGGGGGKSDAEKAHEEALREAERLFEDVETAADKYNRQLERLQFLQEKNYISAETFKRAMEDVREEYQNEEYGEVLDFFEDMSGSIARAAFGMENFGETVKRVLMDIAVQMVQSRVMDFFKMLVPGAPGAAGAGGKAGGGIMGFLSNILSFDGGGWTGDGPRSGGLDGKGGYLAMVHPREFINDTTTGGGGGMVVNISQAPSVPTVKQSEGRLDIDFGRATKNYLHSAEGRRDLRSALSR